MSDNEPPASVWRDFDAERRERDFKPIAFRLGGIDWTCPAVLPAGLYLDEMNPTGEAGAFVNTLDFFRMMLGDEQYPRFLARLKDRDDPIDTSTVTLVMSQLTEEYAARPTPRSSSSDGGPSTIGDGSGSTPPASASTAATSAA